MNLLQLSSETGIPLETLKEWLENEYNIFILSERMPLKPKLVELLASRDWDLKELGQVPDLRQPEPLLPDKTDLLGQLGDILIPELVYTKKLLHYCADHKFLFIIDACSLIHESFYDFYALFKSSTEQAGAKLIVPYVVIEEVKRLLTEHKKTEDVLSRCEKALRFVLTERARGLIDVVGSQDDRRQNERGEKVIHADRVILEKLMYFRNDARSSLFVTQDHDATIDALSQNNLQSSRSNALIVVKKIIKKGALVDNSDDAKNPPLPI